MLEGERIKKRIKTLYNIEIADKNRPPDIKTVGISLNQF